MKTPIVLSVNDPEFQRLVQFDPATAAGECKEKVAYGKVLKKLAERVGEIFQEAEEQAKQPKNPNFEFATIRVRSGAEKLLARNKRQRTRK